MSEEEARDTSPQAVEKPQEEKAKRTRSSSFLNISNLPSKVGKTIKQSPRNLLKQKKQDSLTPVTTEDGANISTLLDSEVSSTETTVATSGENQAVLQSADAAKTDTPFDPEATPEEKPEMKKKTSLTHFLFGSNAETTVDANNTDGKPKSPEAKKSARKSSSARKLSHRSSSNFDSTPITTSNPSIIAPPPTPTSSTSKGSDEDRTSGPTTRVTPPQDDVRKLLDETSTTLENTTVMDMLCAMMESVQLLAQEQKRYNEEKDTRLLEMHKRLEQIGATLTDYSEMLSALKNESDGGSETSARLEKIEAKLVNLETCMKASIVGIKSIANRNCNAVEVLNSTLLDNLERRKRLRNIKENVEGK